MATDAGWPSAPNGEPGTTASAPVAVLMEYTETVLELRLAEYRYNPDGSTARLIGKVPPLAIVEATARAPLVGVIEYEETAAAEVTLAAYMNRPSGSTASPRGSEVVATGEPDTAVKAPVLLLT